MSNEQNIQLQSLTINDAQLLNEVATKAYADHYLHLWHDAGEWYIDKSFAPANLAKELADKNALFYLVFYKEEPVGFLKLNVDAAFENFSKADALELERIYLTKEASAKGVGQFLMNYTIDLAIAKNKKIIWLKVMDSSAGPIAFYQKNGFEICGTHYLNFPQMKEEFRGMYIMRKSL